jgi:outer membrane murein-binding lipoprotein Lpp
VRAKVGTLWTAGAAIVGCAITCTIYVVRMESKVDQTWTATQGINAKLEQIAPQHAILWEWYSRTASRTAPTIGGP